jgi:hypothetical protein
MKIIRITFALLALFCVAGRSEIVVAPAQEKDGKIFFTEFSHFSFLKAKPGAFDYNITIVGGKVSIAKGGDNNIGSINLLLPQALTGDWSQRLVLNAPVMVSGERQVMCSLPMEFSVRLMASYGDGYLELGKKLIKDKRAFGGDGSEVSIFVMRKGSQVDEKILTFRVREQLFQYFPEQMLMLDNSLLGILAYGGAPGAYTMTVVDVKDKHVIGNIYGSQIQFLPYERAFWVRDSFTRAEERAPSFNAASLRSRIVKLYHSNEINRAELKVDDIEEIH